MNPAVLASTDTFYITFMASFFIWIMFGVILILWIVDGKMRKEQALHAVFSVMVAWVICYIIKSVFPTLRPFQLNGFPPLTLTIPLDSSFPSEHTTIAFSLAVSIYLHNKNLGVFMIFLALFVGVGRMLGNVHFFIDIVGGALIGIVSALSIQHIHLFKALNHQKV